MKMTVATCACSGVLTIVLICSAHASLFVLALPISRNRGLAQQPVIWGQKSNRGGDLCEREHEPYRLGLTPYISTVQESNTKQHKIKVLLQHDSNQTMGKTAQTKNGSLSYPHLLLHPDRVNTATTYIVNHQNKSPTSLFIDEWIMQLPSKWAAFVSDGEYKYNNKSTTFPVPLLSTSVIAPPDVRLSNVDGVNPTIADAYDIGTGTFESSNDSDAIWDVSLNSRTLHNASQLVVDNEKPQNKTKIAKVSTQPQSIFGNNFVDQRKNATIPKSTLPRSLNRHPLLTGKDPNTLITVADLEAILRYNMYYSRASMSSREYDVQQPDDKSMSLSPSSQKSNKGTVAFPQPTVLSKSSVKWGSTVSGGTIGILLAISGAPNLWLMGILFGCVYGYETGQRLSTLDDSSTAAFNVLQSLIIYLGRQLAYVTLKAYDTFQAFFFMYKTGQLSYEYYKNYAVLDKKLSIQKKIDAWNARFVEGKLVFDRWEKENEVGRKVLAGLRTIWLVGEQNIKKRSGLLKRSQRHQSRYRLIQFAYDASYTISKICGSFWTSLVGGEIRSEIQNFVRGLIRNDGAQFRGVFLSVISLSLIGALFTISPALLATVAAAIGWIWPTWVLEIIDRVGNFIDVTAARGKGQMSSMQTKREQLKKRVPRYDKNRYHYYRTSDGKKRYYRVGEAWINTGSQFYKRHQPPKKAGPLSWVFDLG